jgi:hypothetical protein
MEHVKPATGNPEARVTQAGAGFGCIVFFFVLAALGCWGYLLLNPVVRYALQYDVPKERVYLQKKPTACDWGTAPLGNKHCHYKKQIEPMSNERGLVTDVYVSWNKIEEE